MNKKSRHKDIIEIIKNKDINSQDLLLNILVENGYNITQATLSRDMKELKIAKVHTLAGDYVYQQTSILLNDELERGYPTLTAGFLSIEFSGSLAVIKTMPGHAMVIAAEIDRKATKTILGTVAGDDTILIIPKENLSREEIKDSLSKIIPNLQ